MQVVTAKVKGHGGWVEEGAVKLYMHISVSIRNLPNIPIEGGLELPNYKWSCPNLLLH